MKFIAAILLISTTTFAGTEIKLSRGTIDTSNSVFDLSQQNRSQSEWLVQFKGRVTEAQKQVLENDGFAILSYIPEDALLVRGYFSQVSRLSQSPEIQAIVAFVPEMKISKEIGTLSSATSNFRQSYLVSVFNQSERSIIEKSISKIDKSILIQKSADRNFVLTTERKNLLPIASIEGVEHIQILAEVQPLHMIFGGVDILPSTGDYSDLTGYETGTKVMNFDSAWSQGINGSGQIVGMADTGLDSGDANNIHRDFSGAVKSGYAVGMFGKTWADPMGHGTHVAGSVLGRGTASSGALKGGAFGSKMVAQGMWSPILNNLSVPSNLAGMFGQAYSDGARIHTNSWGAAANFGAYEKMAATVDQVMFDKEDLLILFAAGNSGVDKNRDGRIDPNSIGTPGTAKNALTVGASENLLAVGGIQRKIGELKSSPDNWPVAPITESKLSDDVNGVAMFSSRGPTNDGRMKPDVVAPGTNILSVKSQQQGASDLWGAYNTDYVYSGGTSMACPLTAASAAVARQYLVEKRGITNPTSALLKAYLLHTATEMFPGQYGEVGASRGQELLTKRPNNDEGYGRVNVAEMVSSTADYKLEQSSGVKTGDAQEFKYAVGAGHFMVNLVWTDAPGSANAAKALVNDLDMEVILPNGQTVANNDQVNNHSFVQGTTGAGTLIIKVKGTNVPMGKAGLQPFALVTSVR